MLAEVAGVAQRFTADIVVVACGAASSAALLLRSASDAHPAGLADGSGQVGRNCIFHNSQAVLALSLTPNDTMFQKTLALDDFYFGMDGFEYPMGNIQMIGKTLGGMYRAEKALLTALVPRRALDDIARHAVDFWLTTEDLPDPDSRVTVDAEGRLTLAYTPKSGAEAKALRKAALDVVAAELPVPSPARTQRLHAKRHRAGTCRFGDNPSTSVLDRDCSAHALDDLYVVDTSFFLSIRAVNPSLTAIAKALRVGDQFLRRLG